MGIFCYYLANQVRIMDLTKRCNWYINWKLVMLLIVKYPGSLHPVYITVPLNIIVSIKSCVLTELLLILAGQLQIIH